MPYLMEAMSMLESGVSADFIDKAATNFGMPMGPIRLADQVGLDICLSVAENLCSHLGGTVPEKLRQMVADGELGCKTGRGFYKYDKAGKRVKSDSDSATTKISKEDCTDRMVLRMLNEAVACYREGVIDNLGWLDAGMVFGTGFAPFRGGPIHYAKSRGLEEVVARLHYFAENIGERFSPDAGWSKLTATEQPCSSTAAEAE